MRPYTLKAHIGPNDSSRGNEVIRTIAKEMKIILTDAHNITEICM